MYKDYRFVNLEQYTDKQIVDGILANDLSVIEYFFFKKCSLLFAYILRSVFNGGANEKELINELYLYLAENDWHKVRQFDYRSKLITWTNVVAVRFFQKKREELMDSVIQDALYKKMEHGTTPDIFINRRMDVRNALQQMPNARYRKVIEMLDLRDIRPELLAEEMNVTIDNLYNIHRRALMQLRLVMGRKENYYD